MLHAEFAGLSVALCVAGAVIAQDEPTTTRPNIVFAFADDWGRYASRYARLEPGTVNDVVRTPNFDRIAQEGVVFTNAFVNAPSCTPCRSSLLSGQHFWRTGRGAILQGAKWDARIPTYPLLLEQSGYHIGFTYKVWSPGTPRDAPHGGKARGYMKHGRRFNGFSQFVSRADDQDTAKALLLDEVRDNFRDFLAARKDGQPFCYWFGPTNCHRKWSRGSGKRLWGIDPDALEGKMPADLPDVPTVREDFADYLGEVMAFDAALGVLRQEIERIGERSQTLIAVSGDHGAPGFPRGKCNLYDFGVHVPLAISWPDRIPWTRHGRVVDDFVGLPDLAPTFLGAAGVTAPEVMTGRSLLAILTSNQTGLVDETRDHVVVGRERHVAKARIDELPYPQRAIRTKDYLYVRNFAPERWPMGTGPGYGLPAAPMPGVEKLRENTFAAFGDLDASPTKAWLVEHRDDPAGRRWFELGIGLRPAEELYDLRTDRAQVHNVAAVPEDSATRDRLAARLRSILTATGDPRVDGDGSTFDRPPFGGPVRRGKSP